MKSRTSTLFTAMTLFAVLAITVQTSAQRITTFDAPGAGTGPGQGTLPVGIDPSGAIMGSYFDGSRRVARLPARSQRRITTFDAPGAGTGSNQGTLAINHECSVSQQMLKRVGRWEVIAPNYEALPLPKEPDGRVLSPKERDRLFAVARSNQNWEAGLT
jgi:hypothetical protein